MTKHKACIQGKIKGFFEITVGEGRNKVYINSENPEEWIPELLRWAEPAKFGRGEETLYDPNIRNTWEIKADKITLPSTLEEELIDKIYDNFAPNKWYTIELQLHNMLIYESGQFFKEHRDAEKAENMIGTVIVSLPVDHTGGNMIIKHHDENFLFDTQHATNYKEILSYVAFYGDCLHEILPVESGHRIILTFNMFLHNPTYSYKVIKEDVNEEIEDSELKESIKRFLQETNVSPKYIVLEHFYSEINLANERLKGRDISLNKIINILSEELNYDVSLSLINFYDIYKDSTCRDEFDDAETFFKIYDKGIENQKVISPADPDGRYQYFDGDEGYFLYDEVGESSSLQFVSPENVLFLKPYDREMSYSLKEGDLGNWGTMAQFSYRFAAFVCKKK